MPSREKCFPTEKKPQLHWLFLINRRNNNDYKSLFYMTSASEKKIWLYLGNFLLHSRGMENNKLSFVQIVGCFMSIIHKQFIWILHKNLIITRRFIEYILLPKSACFSCWREKMGEKLQIAEHVGSKFFNIEIIWQELL